MSGRARWDGLPSALYDVGMAALERWPLRRWRERVRALLRQALPGRPGPAGADGRGGRGGDGPRRVLEVGAGTGLNRLPAELPARVVAVDESLDMLRRARERGYRAAVAADAGALPFPDGAFDAGVETLVWCEVDRPVAALAEVGRVLAPGAPLVMFDHVRPRGVLGPVADALSAVTGPWLGEWWNRDTRRYVRPAGFRTVESRDGLAGSLRALLLEKTAATRTEERREDR